MVLCHDVSVAPQAGPGSDHPSAKIP